jgi:RNA binding exosome subunit
MKRAISITVTDQVCFIGKQPQEAYLTLLKNLNPKALHNPYIICATLAYNKMKKLHNARVRVHSASKELVDSVLDQADNMARIKKEDKIVRDTVRDDGLYIGEIWIDHQPPLRKFLGEMLAGMSAEDKAKIVANSTKHLDTGTHCYFFLKTEEFIKGKIELTNNPNGAVALRFNIACWPANKENAIKVIKEIFA